MKRDQGEQNGQATIEFALVIPLVAIMLLLIVQTAVVVREQVMLINGVREAARAAAVDPSTDVTSVVRSASGLSTVSVSSSDDGASITVSATATVPIVIPVLRSFRKSVSLDARATMRAESG
jgi:Flp pilus assembly protein TadG